MCVAADPTGVVALSLLQCRICGRKCSHITQPCHRRYEIPKIALFSRLFNCSGHRECHDHPAVWTAAEAPILLRTGEDTGTANTDSLFSRNSESSLLLQFIERERLHGVFIHEFIKGCQVRFGLAFELKSRLSAAVSSQASQANTAKSGGNSPPHLSNAPNSNSDNSTQNSSILPAPSTSLIVLFQEVYPGFDALKKVYRSCSVETDH